MKLRLKKSDYFPHQWEFLTSDKTINGLVAGFGAGKTHVFLRKTLVNLFKRTNGTGVSNGWVIYPTLSLAEELFVEPFQELLEEIGLQYKYNQSKHRFTTPAGNIKIYQLQKPQRIIGAELTYIGFDEFDVESWKNCDIAFKKSIGRMRGTNNPEIYIVTSPEGYKYTYRIFVEDDNDDRHLVRGKTTDNTYLPEKYITLLESNYDDNLLKAYRDGEFINLQAGSTYYTWSRATNIGKVKYDRTKPIYIGMDWNVSPLCAILWQKYPDAPNIRIFDEVQLHHAGDGDLLTERMCRVIQDRYPGNIYYTYPDATGAARHSSARHSDIAIVREMKGFQVRVKNINPLVVNRVNAVNKALEGNLIVDESCKAMINDLERVTNIPNTREIDKKVNPELTHMSDALGYSVVWEFPCVKPNLWRVAR